MIKKLIYLILSVILISSCATNLTQKRSALLKKAYKEHNYFELDNLMSEVKFNQSNPDLLLYKAMLNNVFNKPEESNILINKLLHNYPKYFNDSTVANLYSTREVNDCLLQDFRQAYDNDNFLIANFKHACDSAEIESYNNMIPFYHNLLNVPKMEILKTSDSKISCKRDQMGLFNIPVIFGTDTAKFVFDTGANFCTITQTEAKKYGIKILGAKIKVGSATGLKVEAETGITDIKLGSIEIKNVIFCILPDSSLSFAKGAYTIKGIIGFPVMHALQVFTIKDNEYLIFPYKPEEIKKSDLRNFALEGFTPIIKVTYKNEILPFHFDTGAKRTDLYSLFFDKYKTEIIEHSTKKKQTYGGVGGSIESESYLLDSINIAVGNSHTRIDSLRVTEKDLMGHEVKYVYGNFGQDYIKQFSEMRMNFSSMSIIFSNKKK